MPIARESACPPDTRRCQAKASVVFAPFRNLNGLGSGNRGTLATEPGEILVGGEGHMRGYREKPADNKKTFFFLDPSAKAPAEGWAATVPRTMNSHTVEFPNQVTGIDKTTRPPRLASSSGRGASVLPILCMKKDTRNRFKLVDLFFAPTILAAEYDLAFLQIPCFPPTARQLSTRSERRPHRTICRPNSARGIRRRNRCLHSYQAFPRRFLPRNQQ